MAMTADVTSPREGEVVALEEAGARVRLDGGMLGLLPRSSEFNLSIGARRTFQIECRDESGDVILAVVPPADDPPLHSFDQEFDRLHNALANHGPRNIQKQPEHDDALGKERIEGWMARTNDAVARLRKRRAKRLSSQT